MDAISIIEHIVKWYKELSKDAREKLIKVIGVASVCVLVLFAMSNVCVYTEKFPILLSRESLDKEYDFILLSQGAYQESLSVNDLLFDYFGEINNEVALFNSFMDLYEMNESIKAKQKRVTIPSEAAGVEFEKISVYSWCEEKQSLLSYVFQMEGRKDKCYIFAFIGDIYIFISFGSNWNKVLDVDACIECGRVLGVE